MLNYAARRVALLAVLAATTVVTGSACGARPTASVGEPVILAAPAPAPKLLPQPRQPSQAVTPSQGTTPSPEPKSSGKPDFDPEALVAAARAVEPNTTLGVVVHDRVTGATMLSVEADRQFRSASLVKLMIAIDVLDRGASDAEREQLHRMLSASDDDIASAFWVQSGPDLIPRVVALVGLRSTEAPEQPGQWGQVKLTANDVLRVYRYVMDRMPPKDRALVVDALAYAPEHAADGFDQSFGLPDGLDEQWAVKQGWGNDDHAMVLHSSGLVGKSWRYVVVLLSEHPLGSGWRTSADSVTAAASELTGKLPGA